jgi:SAM-dependent MidA family methyltransferase
MPVSGREPRGEGDDRSGDSDPELVAAIRVEIAAAGGRIPFARFMDLALYHPDHGYYATSAERPTRSGDFLTAPEVHPMFATLLARQLSEMWQRLGRPSRFVLREHGAGRGVLGEGILRALHAEDPPLAEALTYDPVDIPGRADLARERLRGAGFEANVGPVVVGPIVGCILANELLDALPVHRLGRLDGELVEWQVEWRDGWFHEVAAAPSTPELGVHLARAGVELRERQRAEVALGVPRWIGEAATSLERGYLLLIDYGFSAAELYGPRRLGGTLRAFRGHHAGDDPFRAVGRQDLTAHVDLTTVEIAARDAGLTALGRTTQAEFLIGLGLGELLQDAQRDPAADWEALLAARTAAGRFIDPGALGGFAVMVFGRDVEVEPPLRGLGFRVPRPGVARSTSSPGTDRA